MRLSKIKMSLAAIVLAATTAMTPATLAADLTIGLAAEASSMDPHFQNYGPNNALLAQIFDRLIHQDANQQLIPGLATSWTVIDDVTWEFKLREGITFHDGSAFDAEDVAATLRRIPWVPNSPSSFAVNTRAIADITIVDAHTVHVTTSSPSPQLPNDLSIVNIVPAEMETTPSADFAKGAAIGTGPFKFVSLTPGQGVELARNDAYWGGAPEWESVELKFIPNSAARVAALLSGDVDMIEDTPTADVANIEKNENFTLARAVSNLLMYLHLDSFRDQTVFATDNNDQPLAENPLKDVRVREALSLAIDRQAIADRIMGGGAVVTGGLVPEGFFGYDPELAATTFDAERAKQLLAEAGYPEGFKLTIHGTSDRFLNDSRVLQAIGPMFSRVGVTTKVESMPIAAFLPRASNPNFEFATILLGWNVNTGEVSSSLRGLLATIDPDKGWGPSNRGRYSNPELDELLSTALGTLDDEARKELLMEAARLGVRDYGILPLYFQVITWSLRDGLTYEPRADLWTLAQFVKSAD